MGGFIPATMLTRMRMVISFSLTEKDIIRKKGENISAAEVEGVVNENPKVLESAVIAVLFDLGEDDVMACVVLMVGQSMTGEELIDWSKDSLADFKLPRFVQFRESLPKTSPPPRVASPFSKKLQIS